MHFRPNRAFLFCAMVGACFWTAGSASVTETSEPPPFDPGISEGGRAESADAWAQAQRRAFQNAFSVVRRLEDTNDPELLRHVRFSEALLLLNVQPLTQENVRRAKAIFQDLAAGPEEDALKRMAWYHYARTLEWHQSPIDFDGAYHAYLELYESAPDDYVAQLAMMRAGVMDVLGRYYASKEELRARLRHWTGVAEHLTFPGPRRNLFNVVGDTIAIHGFSPEWALDVYTRASDTGYTRWDFRMLGVIRQFMWSRRVGQTERAIQAMEQFLETYSFTPYAFYVRQMLKEARNAME